MEEASKKTWEQLAKEQKEEGEEENE